MSSEGRTQRPDGMWWLWAGTLAIFGLLLRVGVDASLRGWQLDHGDALTSYSKSAAAIARSGIDGVSLQHPPLFQLFLGAVASLASDGPRPLLVASAALGALNVVGIGLLAFRWGGPRAGLIGAGVAAVYVYLWVYDSLLLSETMAQTIVILFLLVLTELQRQPTILTATALGIVLGLGALTRPEMALYFAAVPIIGYFTTERSWRRALKIAAVSLAVAIVVAAPWSLRQSDKAGKFVFGSLNGGQTLVSVNCPSTYSGPTLGYKDLRCLDAADAVEGNAAGPALQDSNRAAFGRTYMRDHLDQLPMVMMARVGRAFGVFRPMQQMDFDQTFEAHGARWVVVLGSWQWNILVPCAVYGALVIRRRGQSLWGVATVLGVTVVTIALAYGNTRYRAPIEPMIVALAAVGISSAVGSLWGDTKRAAPSTNAEPKPNDALVPGTSLSLGEPS